MAKQNGRIQGDRGGGLVMRLHPNGRGGQEDYRQICFFFMLEIFGAGDKEEKRPKKLQIGGGPLRHRQEWTIIERAVRNILFVSACVRVGN